MFRFRQVKRSFSIGNWFSKPTQEIVPPAVSTIPTPIESAKTLTPSIPQEGMDIANLVQTASDITYFGQIKEFGMGGFGPVGFIQHIMELIHVQGVPWWGSILITTLLIRVATTPISLAIQKNSEKMKGIQGEMKEIQARIQAFEKANQRVNAQQEMMKLQTLFKDHDIQPWKAVYSLLLAPIFICNFLAVTRFVDVSIPGFSTGGFAWVSDLTLTDPYYILPILSTVIGLASIEYNLKMAPQSNAMFGLVARGLILVFLPFSLGFSSGTLLYVIAGMGGSLLQNAVFRQPAFRTWAKLPPFSPAQSTKTILETYPMSLSNARRLLKTQ